MAAIAGTVSGKFMGYSTRRALVMFCIPVQFLWATSFYWDETYDLAFLSVLSVCMYTALLAVPSHSTCPYTLALGCNMLIILYGAVKLGPCATSLKTVLSAGPVMFLFLTSNFKVAIFLEICVFAVLLVLNYDPVCLPLDMTPLNFPMRFAIDFTFTAILFVLGVFYSNSGKTGHRTRSHFLTTISHELRTPLHGLLCASELLMEDGELNDEDQEHVSTIYGCGQVLSGIINNILDSGALENNEKFFSASGEDVIDVDRFCNQMKAIGTHVGKHNSLELIVDIPEQIGSIKTNVGKLSQIYLNLLNNAIKV